MTALAKEVQYIQNPALVAGLIWRYVCGYVEAHRTRDPTPLPLVFLVAPIVLYQQTEAIVAETQRASGLRAFAAKFGKSDFAKQDLLLGINQRALVLRSLTMDALRIALATRLLHLTEATLIPLSVTPAVAGIPKDVRRLLASAQKLGTWSGALTLHEVATTLKVRF